MRIKPKEGVHLRGGLHNIPFPEYSSMFWDAVNADLDTIYNLCQTVREGLRDNRVRIISPEREELTFSVKGRRIN